MYGTYFSQIDTSNKAYILGLIFADGCLKNIGQLALEENSKNLLEQIALEIGCNQPRYIPSQENRYSKKGQYRISIGKERENLKKLIGINKDKLPTLEANLRSHFLRGVFDGDGTISLDKRYIKLYPNSAIPGDFHILFNFREHAEACSLWLQEEAKVNKTKIIQRYGQGMIPIYRIRWGGTNSLISIRSWLYKDAEIQLERKKNIFFSIKEGDIINAARKGGLANAKIRKDNATRLLSSSLP